MAGLQAYEHPENPELVVKTVEWSVEECVQQIVAVLEQNRILPKMRPTVRSTLELTFKLCKTKMCVYFLILYFNYRSGENLDPYHL